ncbi:E3 ubiquitin-protein ligase Siah1-like protein [Lates japonicus]|uniref:E3 ubiquitin-protein ligase Siah1-like protein n=1 Tax=Lates japonicus TaxID=270547 RepID=A0AAD3R9G9_LATJO|nr:E3 ubiquitin-protein ligase Siah1-like protein [Lates japonicus]
MMQSCFGFHFMLVLEKQEKYDGHQQFFAIVQPTCTASRSRTCLPVELTGTGRWPPGEATAKAHPRGHYTAIMNSDCLGV